MLSADTHHVVVFLAARTERAPDIGKADEDHELDDLARPLVHRVDAEAHIVQRDLEPGGPQDAEEADVGPQRRPVDDGVRAGEGREVGDEEEVEEELEVVRLVPQLQDQVVAALGEGRDDQGQNVELVLFERFAGPTLNRHVRDRPSGVVESKRRLFLQELVRIRDLSLPMQAMHVFKHLFSALADGNRSCPREGGGGQPVIYVYQGIVSFFFGSLGT